MIENYRMNTPRNINSQNKIIKKSGKIINKRQPKFAKLSGL